MPDECRRVLLGRGKLVNGNRHQVVGQVEVGLLVDVVADTRTGAITGRSRSAVAIRMRPTSSVEPASRVEEVEAVERRSQIT